MTMVGRKNRWRLRGRRGQNDHLRDSARALRRLLQSFSPGSSKNARPITFAIEQLNALSRLHISPSSFHREIYAQANMTRGQTGPGRSRAHPVEGRDDKPLPQAQGMIEANVLCGWPEHGL